MQRTDGTHGHPALGSEDERARLAHRACVGHVVSHSLLSASVRSLHSGCDRPTDLRNVYILGSVRFVSFQSYARIYVNLAMA